MHNTKIMIVDEIMGKGKTSAAINYINDSDKEERFLVITPYTTEIERYKMCCRSKHFIDPYPKDGSKLCGLKELIRNGSNIVSTHALFQRFDEELIDLCRQLNYTLIMDEVTDVVEEYKISDADLNLLNDRYIRKDEETHQIIWIEQEDEPDKGYQGRFEDVRNLCKFGCLFSYNKGVLIWLFPVEVFKAFEKVFIMTYMFDVQVQRYYYDFFKTEYSYIYITGNDIDSYRFSETPDDSYVYPDFSKLIHIVEDDKLNSIGDKEHYLSVGWYERNTHTPIMKKVKDNLYNFKRHISETDSRKFMWGTFKKYENEVVCKGAAKRFVPINARATNDYRKCTAVAYLVNRYFNPIVKGFFTDNNVRVDEDGYALSEMLQYIWRSAIREGNGICIYVPSCRMRRLLKEWISNIKEKREIKTE